MNFIIIQMEMIVLKILIKEEKINQKIKLMKSRIKTLL